MMKHVPNPGHLLRSAACGLMLLAACPATATAKITNQAPIADAGLDQDIGTASLVQLTGLKSSDPDGNLKSYRWVQLKGQKVKLSDSKIATPSFTSPATLPAKTSARNLVFKLTVTDNKNKKASDSVTINLVACLAPQILVNNVCQLPPPVCYAPNRWQNGQCLPPASNCILPQVMINGSCQIPSSTCPPPLKAQNGVCSLPVISQRLNDTGVTFCSNTELNGDFCPNDGYPGQDGEFGRDQFLNDNSDGRAGFSFTKLDANGNPLPTDALDWNCIKDNVSGLIWEHKSNDGGLHDKNRLFFFEPAQIPANTSSSQPQDVVSYINAINAEQWCGGNDWRLPSRFELQGIVDYSVFYPGPTVDFAFFPNTANDKFWTSTPHASDSNQIWVVYFDDGRIFLDSRARQFRVRLVRNAPTDRP